MARIKNLVGKRFENLFVIKMIEPRINYKTYWLCNCTCGNEKILREDRLLSGESTDCGCSKITDRAAKHALYHSYESTAKKRGLEFSLSIFFFNNITKKDCYYCGNKPNNVRQSRYGEKSKFSLDYTYNGIDRIDSSVGYIESNCVPCCFICNRAKGTMTQEEFKNWILKINSNLSNWKKD